MPYNSVINRDDSQALMPEDVSRDILQALTSNSFTLRMARRLPDMPRQQRRVPVLSVLPVAYFVNGDAGLKRTTEVNWSNVYLTAEELAVIVPIPQNVLDDSDYPIWENVNPHIVTALGQKIDSTILYGGMADYGKPSNDWPDGIVRAAASAGHAVSLASTNNDLYDAVLGTGGTAAYVEEDGFAVSGHIAPPSMRAQIRGARDANGQPIFNRNPLTPATYDMDGIPLQFPTNGAVNADNSLLISGAFQELVYAMRQDITFTIADQGVITDETGAIVYNLFQQDMVALRVTMRMAWQVPNPPSYLSPGFPSSSRYPFAVLTK